MHTALASPATGKPGGKPGITGVAGGALWALIVGTAVSVQVDVEYAGSITLGAVHSKSTGLALVS